MAHDTATSQALTTAALTAARAAVSALAAAQKSNDDTARLCQLTTARAALEDAQNQSVLACTALDAGH